MSHQTTASVHESTVSWEALEALTRARIQGFMQRLLPVALESTGVE